MSVQSISLIEGPHYRLIYYEDHGWEWKGYGLFGAYCCERPYLTEDAARDAAIAGLLKLLAP